MLTTSASWTDASCRASLLVSASGTVGSMSSRYPLRRTCPDCGLEVAAKASGKVRAHGELARSNGRSDSPCAISSNAAQREVASRFQAEAKPRRDAFYAGRDRESTLPPHLR